MSSDLLRDKWQSLGVAFNASSTIVSDPESALICFLESKEFPDDRKIMALILAWLKEYSNLVHIERLKSLIEPLGSFELALLGGIAEKCIQFGDFRWRTITKYISKKNSGNPQFEIGESDYLISKKGPDLEFKNYGVNISKIEPEKVEKILVREQIIVANKWIRNRVLFGVNMRADVATVINLKLASSAYQASKLLRCSFNAASRNWNDLVSVNFNG
jgi:hypothetical protein